jgi:hypothetical protein
MIFLIMLYLIIYWIVLYFEFLAQVNSYPGKRPCSCTWRLFTSLIDASLPILLWLASIITTIHLFRIGAHLHIESCRSIANYPSYDKGVK